MDATLIQALTTLILGSGGIIGAINYYRARRSRRIGIPADEHGARRVADNTALNKYWQAEVATFRKERAIELAELRAEIVALRRLRHEDAMQIDALEEHIWLRREPPPPKRKDTPE